MEDQTLCISIVIPNDNVSEVTQIKKDFDSTYIAKHQN